MITITYKGVSEDGTIKTVTIPWSVKAEKEAPNGYFISNPISDPVKALKQQLSDTDYMSLKHSEGALSDEDFEFIKRQRAQWREEINILEGNINGNIL